MAFKLLGSVKDFESQEQILASLEWKNEGDSQLKNASIFVKKIRIERYSIRRNKVEAETCFTWNIMLEIEGLDDEMYNELSAELKFILQVTSFNSSPCLFNGNVGIFTFEQLEPLWKYLKNILSQTLCETIQKLVRSKCRVLSSEEKEFTKKLQEYQKVKIIKVNFEKLLTKAKELTKQAPIGGYGKSSCSALYDLGKICLELGLCHEAYVAFKAVEEDNFYFEIANYEATNLYFYGSEHFQEKNSGGLDDYESKENEPFQSGLANYDRVQTKQKLIQFDFENSSESSLNIFFEKLVSFAGYGSFGGDFSSLQAQNPRSYFAAILTTLADERYKLCKENEALKAEVLALKGNTTESKSALEGKAYNGSIEAINTLLHEYKADPNLMIAASSGNIGAVNLILQSVPKPDPNLRGKDECTALMFAAQYGHEKVAETLLKAGSDVNLQNNEGCTALMLAVSFRHEKTVETLLEAGANTNLQDNAGYTALMFAAQDECEEMVEVLLKAGSDVNLKNNVGYTALMVAVQSGHEKVVKILLEAGSKAGSDVNLKNNVGYTALIIAAQYGHVKVVEILLKEKPDVNLQSCLEGYTALMLAAAKGHVKIVETLLKAGANTDLQDNKGNTVLILATLYGHESVKILLQSSNKTGKTFTPLLSNFNTISNLEKINEGEIIKTLHKIVEGTWKKKEDKFWILVSAENKQVTANKLSATGLNFTSRRVKDSTDYCIMVEKKDAERFSSYEMAINQDKPAVLN